MAGLASFKAMITGQAALIGIPGTLKLMIVVLIVSPLALLLREPRLAG